MTRKTTAATVSGAALLALIDPPVIVSLAQIADFLNLSRTRVTQLVNDGVLPKRAPGQYDLEACARSYIKFVQDHMGKRQTIGDTNEARARLLAAKAASAEIELAVQEETYAPVSEMLEVMTTSFGICKEHLLALPSKCMPTFMDVAGSQARKLYDTVEREILEALARREILR